MFSRHRGHTFVAPPTDNEIQIVLSSNTFDFNLLALLGAALTEVTTVTIRIETGVIVMSMSPGTPAMDLSNVMFAGSTLRVINAGYILGHGGAGGDGAAGVYEVGGLQTTSNEYGGEDGEDGGDAILGPGAGITFELTNGAGRIWGGGGGGGGGGASFTGGANRIANGGGGGGGAGGGAFGAGGKGQNTFIADADADDGTGGSTGVNGTNGTGGTGNQAGGGTGGAGGDGGDWGSPGGAGTSPTSGSQDLSGGSGGAAGKAIELNGGAATFLNGGGGPNVKGAVT